MNIKNFFIECSCPVGHAPDRDWGDFWGWPRGALCVSCVILLVFVSTISPFESLTTGWPEVSKGWYVCRIVLQSTGTIGGAGRMVWEPKLNPPLIRKYRIDSTPWKKKGNPVKALQWRGGCYGKKGNLSFAFFAIGGVKVGSSFFFYFVHWLPITFFLFFPPGFLRIFPSLFKSLGQRKDAVWYANKFIGVKYHSNLKLPFIQHPYPPDVLGTLVTDLFRHKTWSCLCHPPWFIPPLDRPLANAIIDMCRPVSNGCKAIGR